MEKFKKLKITIFGVRGAMPPIYKKNFQTKMNGYSIGVREADFEENFSQPRF